MICATGRALASSAILTAAGPLFANPSARRFRIGACEWSLRKADPSCFEVAKEIGLDGVQVDMGRAADGMRMRHSEVQRAYIESARRSGLEIASLATAEFNNVALKCEPRAAIWLNDAIGVAQALGVKVILVAQFFNGDLKGDKIGTDRTVELLKVLAPRRTWISWPV